SISAQFTIGPELEKALKFTKVDVLGLADSGPVIGTVKDCFSNTYNRIITPKNALIITGKKIKIIGDDSQVGVYLTNTDGGMVTKVSQIVVNSPRQLTIMLPAMDKGHYQLSVVTQFTGCSKLLKVPHSVSYRHHLQVE
ncbi:MAG: DUF4469 domain-containing protein, partial [Chlorobiales bacterium]|nr:DUF4469 domain-containing protein [Chlorobiales bacterium]